MPVEPARAAPGYSATMRVRGSQRRKILFIERSPLQMVPSKPRSYALETSRETAVLHAAGPEAVAVQLSTVAVSAVDSPGSVGDRAAAIAVAGHGCAGVAARAGIGGSGGRP